MNRLFENVVGALIWGVILFAAWLLLVLTVRDTVPR